MRNKFSAPGLLSLAFLSGNALAAGFTNGGFETGDLTGWSQGSGFTSGYDTTILNPVDYLPGGARYNAAAASIEVVTQGTYDPITAATTVYNGQHAVRVNDAINNYGVNVLKQTVSNYQENKIVFEWNAVLQSSHDLTDSDAFNLTLTDDTTHAVLVSRSYSSASAPGIFTAYNTGWETWYSSGWQVESLDVSALQGHSFTLSLLATDCPYGGHAGYVYLDGFGGTQVPPGPVPGVPEPEAYALMLAGLGMVGLLARKRRQA